MSDKDKLMIEIYKDALSPGMKVLGQVGEDLAKAAKLIALPITYTARLSEKIDTVLQKINNIPEEQRVNVHPQISVPLMDFMPLIDNENGNELWELFENIFVNSADSHRVGFVHPAFCQILAQLTKDEAYILKCLKTSPFVVKDELIYNAKTNKFTGREYISCGIPFNETINEESFNIYYEHLHSLMLIEWPVIKEEPKRDASGVQIASVRDSLIRLTSFGTLFMNACTRK